MTRVPKTGRCTTRWPRHAALGIALSTLAPLARADDPPVPAGPPAPPSPIAPSTPQPAAPQAPTAPAQAGPAAPAQPAPAGAAPGAQPAPQRPVTALEDATRTVAAGEDAGRLSVSPYEIVVSADRGVPLRYAGGRDVIDRETLDRYPDGNIITAIRRVPGVYVLPEQGNDGKVHIGIRGNSPRRSGYVTLLVDGVPSAEAPYGSTDVDYLPVSLERVARMDVIRGGASVRYGPNAAAGVVNFVTEPIPERDTLRLFGRYGSDADYAAGVAAGGTWNRFGALATYVRKGGDGFRDNAEYDIDDGSVKMSFAFNERDTLTAQVSRYLELDAEMPGGLTPEAYEDDPDQSQREGQDFRGDISTWSAQFVHEVSPTSSFQLLGWYHSGQRDLYGFRPNPPPFEQRTAQHSLFRAGALEGRYVWETEILGARNRFFHSARFLGEQNYLHYFRDPLDGGPREDTLKADFETTAVAFFNEDVVSLTDTLDFAFGARMEVISMGSEGRTSLIERDEDYHEFLPTASLTWLVQPQTAVFASVQRTFFTPQYETGFDPSSSIFHDVDPEHAECWEFGTRMREIQGVEFTLSYFDTRYEDKIEFVNQPNGTKLTYNVGEAWSRGFEWGLNVDCGKLVPALSGFSLYGTLTDMKATAETGENERNDLPEAPRLLSSWGAMYEHARTGLWGRIGGSFSDRSFHEPENFRETDESGQQGIIPSFTLWDAAVGWRQNTDGSGFSLTAGVTNLFDEEYFRRFGGGIEPGAPRQLFVSAGWTLAW